VDFNAFTASLAGTTPPAGLADPLRALWHAARGEWDAAHRIAMDMHNTAGSWIHAHLHREEGDISNAGYWYARAGKAPSTAPLEEERRRLIEHFLNHKDK